MQPSVAGGYGCGNRKPSIAAALHGRTTIDGIVVNLDGLTMNAVETDENGVIGIDTIFKFRQAGEFVSAEYAGGEIWQGYLVGISSGDKLVFRYCQSETDGTLNGGESTCRLELGATGLVQIIEEFEWASRPGGGRNVIQELDSHDA